MQQRRTGATGLPPHLRRGIPDLAEDRPAVVRRTGRPDRADAQGAGRREEVDRRAALSVRAQLLHAAAGPRGDAARDLCRLAPARARRRADGGAAVRAAGRAGRAGAERALRRVRQAAAQRSAVPRRQGGRAGDRGRGAVAGRQAGAEGQRRLGDRRARVPRHLLLRHALPGDRAGRRALWLLDRPRQAVAGAAAALPVARAAVADAGHRRRCGSRSGSCRCWRWRPCSAAATC